MLDSWIEIGYESYTELFVRASDKGSVVGKGKRKYPRFEDAVKDLDRG
jgi:hypothetical protein